MAGCLLGYGKANGCVFFKITGKEIQAESFNQIVMCISIFNYLQVHRHIEIAVLCRVLFEKVMPKHHDRSVELKQPGKSCRRLYLFPEEIKHVPASVGIGCSQWSMYFERDAYYAWGRILDPDIPNQDEKLQEDSHPGGLVPAYEGICEKQGIGVDDYVFQNRRAAHTAKLPSEKKMINCCVNNHIKNGEYIFRSHDYRHSIATLFYDKRYPSRLSGITLAMLMKRWRNNTSTICQEAGGCKWWILWSAYRLAANL